MKNILALLADWANGIFALLLAAWMYDVTLVWWYVGVAIVAASVPDIDALPELLQRGKVSASVEHARDHRTFLHYPIITLPLVALLWYFGGFWGALIGTALVLHLVNDLYGTGWGLPLLWPFNNTRYKVFVNRTNQLRPLFEGHDDSNMLPHSDQKIRLVANWTEAELHEHIVRDGVDDWIEQTYLRLNWISITEYSLFFLAIVLLLSLHPYLLYF